MSFISKVEEVGAGPDLRPLYDRIKEHYGFLPNYYQALGHRPDIVSAHLALGAAIMQDGTLPEAVKEQVGIAISGMNTSSYCIAIHMEFLRRMGVEKAMGRKLATDYPSAPVGDNIQALLRFADKLTHHPGDMEKGDVEELRRAGWSEQAVLEIVLAVSFFNFINRISTGLGLVAEF